MIILLILQSGGMFLLFTIQQGMHQYTMMRRVEKESSGFETIRLAYDTYVTSLVEEHEVRLNGQMFDVKRIRHFNDSVELTARRDHKEEHIMMAIRSLLPGQQNHRKVPDFLVKMISWQYLQTAQCDFAALPVLVDILDYKINSELCDVFTGPGSPPPEDRYRLYFY